MPTFPNIDHASAVCPSCGASPLHCFYELKNIPTFSNFVLRTALEAKDVPTSTLQLNFCSACGFITNSAFDPSTQQRAARYEATQGCSGTFSAYAKYLAKKWIAKYDLHHKRILEIGCGPGGEFLNLLCTLSNSLGVGVDPIANPQNSGSTVRLVAAAYSEAIGNDFDFICCRHTLEHIAKPQAMIRELRRIIGVRDCVVALEVPDVLRVLREGGFWDLYYEHCSYFTPGSLARLFRQCSFDILDIRREYDEQYIVIEARPAPGPTTQRLNLEDDLAAVTDAVKAFDSICSYQLKHWRRVIEENLREGQKTAVWGSGSKAVGFLTTLRIDDEIVPYVVDINPAKQGTYLPGTAQQIVPPAQLIGYRPNNVIVMNPIYRGEIAADLHQMNVPANLLLV